MIANDALEYFLLINDNTVADSTQTALKQFAKGDYLLYQNRNQEATVQFQLILKSFKGQDIEAVTDVASRKNLRKSWAIQFGFKPISKILSTIHSEGIYVDEALYFLAEIQNNKLQQPEKAKPLYEKNNFQSSR